MYPEDIPFFLQNPIFSNYYVKWLEFVQRMVKYRKEVRGDHTNLQSGNRNFYHWLCSLVNRRKIALKRKKKNGSCNYVLRSLD